MFSTSVFNSTAVAVSLSCMVVAHSNRFGVWGIRLGVRRQLLNLIIRQFRLL